MKECVNDVNEYRYNWKINGLKEMRWNRIKWKSSRMIGKETFDGFETSASESGEKVMG